VELTLFIADPLFVFAFIHTLLDVLQEYLGEVSAGTIRDNFDVVYQVSSSLNIIRTRPESHQLLEEMLDNGYPLTTEPNALRDIIMPPSLFKKILAVAGTAGSVINMQPCPSLTVSTRRMAKAAPTPFSSPIPWRATGLRYNRNEIFFDIVEEMQGIVGRYVGNASVDSS
jgi:AP-3 complex subunit mu